MSRMNDFLEIYKKIARGETNFTLKEEKLIEECKEIKNREKGCTRVCQGYRG